MPELAYFEGQPIIPVRGVSGAGASAAPIITAPAAQVMDLTLSVDTLVYAIGDVLADTQSLASVFRVAGGTVTLLSVGVLDEDDQGLAFDLIFLDSNVSLGTENSPPSITDVNARQIIGRLAIPAAAFTDLGGNRVAQVSAGSLLLEAAAGSTTLYVGAIAQGAATYTASGLKLKLGFLQN